MRVIRSDSGFLAFQKIFRHLVSHGSRIVMWQLHASDSRQVYESQLNSFHFESGLLHFEAPFATMDPSLPVFCYAEDGQLIFKTAIEDMKDSVVSFLIPSEIKLLEDPDVSFIHGQIGLDLSPVWRTKRIDLDALEDGSDILKVKSMAERSGRDQEFLNNEFDSVSLDEEEKMFADKRESPRARPKKDKWVKVKIADDPEVHFVRLFDLSRGGLGFVVMEPDKFLKGAQVQVVGFDEFDLDDPLMGKIMSHRAIDEIQIEFKVGVKFDEGQG